MKKEIIKTGKTVDTAIEEACLELGLSRDQVEFEILDLPKKGFLGLKNYPAKVRVFVEEKKEDIAVNYIRDVLTAMGAGQFTVSAQREGENLNIILDGDDLGFVIGRRGETIDAIQYLTSLVINRLEGEYLRLTIDSGNFREKREKTLESLAKRLARTVVKTGRSITLEPMNPYERRIIHSTVSTVEGASSSSIGEEPNRKVVISSLNPKKNTHSRDGKRKPYHREERRSGEKNFRKGNRPPRKQTSASESQTVETRNVSTADVLPQDAENKPLYSKIEL